MTGHIEKHEKKYSWGAILTALAAMPAAGYQLMDGSDQELRLEVVKIDYRLEGAEEGLDELTKALEEVEDLEDQVSRLRESVGILRATVDALSRGRRQEARLNASRVTEILDAIEDEPKEKPHRSYRKKAVDEEAVQKRLHDLFE